MTEGIWQRDEPQSPCVRLCSIHPEAQICVGCFRTLDEIAGWAEMSPQARAEVMEALPGREALLLQRRGGRKRR